MGNDNYSEEVPNTSNEPTLIVDSNIKGFLTETIKWGKFLAIMGFVFTALIALSGIFLIFFGSILTSKFPMGTMMGGFIGILYLVMGLLYYFPSKYLYDFCVHTKRALQTNDQESLAYAFSRMKSLYKFWGILMIIGVVFYGIGALLGIMGAFFAASMNW